MLTAPICATVCIAAMLGALVAAMAHSASRVAMPPPATRNGWVAAAQACMSVATAAAGLLCLAPMPLNTPAEATLAAHLAPCLLTLAGLWLALATVVGWRAWRYARRMVCPVARHYARHAQSPFG